MPALDIDLLKDVEELTAIGVGYERLVAMIQDRHHERARDNHRKLHGLDELEVVDIPMPKGASSRTIDRIIRRVKDRWAREEVELRGERRQELRQKLQATFLKAYGEGGPAMGAAVRCLQLEAKLNGLEAPQKIEINGQINIKAMSPDQRRARMTELWAIRQEAVAAGKVIDVLPTKTKRKKLPAKKPTKKKAKAKKKAPARARKKTKK